MTKDTLRDFESQGSHVEREHFDLSQKRVLMHFKDSKMESEFLRTYYGEKL